MPIQTGSRLTGYKVKDAMFPKSELIKDALDAAGYDLHEGYSGSSTNATLADLCNELINRGRLEFFENIWLQINPRDIHPVLSALVYRFTLTVQEAAFVNIALNRLTVLCPEAAKEITKNVNGFLYLIHVSILLSERKFTGGIMPTIVNAWWTMYPQMKNLPPIAVIRNIINVLSSDVYAPTSQSRAFLADLPDAQQMKHLIYLATRFNMDQFTRMLNSNVTARKAMYFITEGGYTNFEDMFVVADSIPDEWFKELI